MLNRRKLIFALALLLPLAWGLQAAELREVIIHASAAETATGNSGKIRLPGSESRRIDVQRQEWPHDVVRGIHLILDVTAASGTSPTLDVTLERYDPGSDGFIAMPGAAFAQKTGISVDDLIIYPGIAETANRSVSDVLSQHFRLVWTIAGTTPSFTFTIGATYLP